MVSRAKAQSKTAVEQTLRLFTSTKKLVLVALLSLLACGKSNRMLTICVQADGGKTCEDLGQPTHILTECVPFDGGTACEQFGQFPSAENCNLARRALRHVEMGHRDLPTKIDTPAMWTCSEAR